MSPTTPTPVRQVPSTDGVALALHDLGGEGPPVLLCHPTGFLGMTWAPVGAALRDGPLLGPRLPRPRDSASRSLTRLSRMADDVLPASTPSV